MPVKDYIVPLVTCTLTAAIVCLDTVLICYCSLNTIIIVIKFEIFCGITLYIFRFKSTYTVAMIHTSTGIGIARGQYYRILGALLGIVLTLPQTRSSH